MSATLSVQISVPSATTTTCQNVRGGKDEGGAVPLLTQLLRLRGQQPTCWRRESPGPRTPALAPVSSGPAGAAFHGYMTPNGPSPAPFSSPPDSPSLSTPGRRSLASLGRFSTFFVCLCLGSFLHCARVCFQACVAYVRVYRPPLRSCSRLTIGAQLLISRMWLKSQRGVRSEAWFPAHSHHNPQNWNG